MSHQQFYETVAREEEFTEEFINDYKKLHQEIINEFKEGNTDFSVYMYIDNFGNLTYKTKYEEFDDKVMYATVKVE